MVDPYIPALFNRRDRPELPDPEMEKVLRLAEHEAYTQLLALGMDSYSARVTIRRIQHYTELREAFRIIVDLTPLG